MVKSTKMKKYKTMFNQSGSKKSHRPNLIYRFTVLDSPEINAFATGMSSEE